MDDRSHLHDAEKLLCNLISSKGMVFWIVFRSILDAVVIGTILSLVSFMIAFFGIQTSLSLWVYSNIVVFTYIAVIVQRLRVRSHARFRVTTERILIEDPRGFFHPHMHTIKWPQYQESHTGHRSFFDFFAGARPLCIKYGSADAFNETCFPSLRYAEDLKHYLDKVDSAARRNDLQSVSPFIAKPKGKRDQTES